MEGPEKASTIKKQSDTDEVNQKSDCFKMKHTDKTETPSYAMDEFNKTRKIIIKGIPPVTYEEVRHFLKSYRISYIVISKKKRQAIVSLVNGSDAEDIVCQMNGKQLVNENVTVALHSNDTLLCVTNVPLHLTDDEFRQFLSGHGPIERCFLMRTSHTEESKGYGCVEFSHNLENMLDVCKKINQAVLDTHTLSCEPLGPDITKFDDLHANCVIIRGLPDNFCHQKELRSVVSDVAEPKFFKVATHADLCLGFAIVEFYKHRHAEYSVQFLNNRTVGPQKISVSYCMPARSGQQLYDKTVNVKIQEMETNSTDANELLSKKSDKHGDMEKSNSKSENKKNVYGNPKLVQQLEKTPQLSQIFIDALDILSKSVNRDTGVNLRNPVVQVALLSVITAMQLQQVLPEMLGDEKTSRMLAANIRDQSDENKKLIDNVTAFIQHEMNVKRDGSENQMKLRKLVTIEPKDNDLIANEVTNFLTHFSQSKSLALLEKPAASLLGSPPSLNTIAKSLVSRGIKSDVRPSLLGVAPADPLLSSFIHMQVCEELGIGSALHPRVKVRSLLGNGPVRPSIPSLLSQPPRHRPLLPFQGSHFRGHPPLGQTRGPPPRGYPMPLGHRELHHQPSSRLHHRSVPPAGYYDDENLTNHNHDDPIQHLMYDAPWNTPAHDYESRGPPAPNRQEDKQSLLGNPPRPLLTPNEPKPLLSEPPNLLSQQHDTPRLHVRNRYHSQHSKPYNRPKPGNISRPGPLNKSLLGEGRRHITGPEFNDRLNASNPGPQPLLSNPNQGTKTLLPEPVFHQPGRGSILSSWDMTGNSSSLHDSTEGSRNHVRSKNASSAQLEADDSGIGSNNEYDYDQDHEQEQHYMGNRKQGTRSFGKGYSVTEPRERETNAVPSLLGQPPSIQDFRLREDFYNYHGTGQYASDMNGKQMHPWMRNNQSEWKGGEWNDPIANESLSGELASIKPLLPTPMGALDTFGMGSEELWNKSNKQSFPLETPERRRFSRKRSIPHLLPSPEPSPDGGYIGQHSQGLGGHYADSYRKRLKL